MVTKLKRKTRNKTVSFPRGLSLVIPVKSIEAYHKDLMESLIQLQPKLQQEHSLPLEVIFVLDGFESDGSNELFHHSEQKAFVRQVHLKKNHGQMRATHIGVLHAQYSIIATMDDDLQYDPLDLIDMVDRLVREKKLSVVFGAPRQHRHERSHVRNTSAVRWLFNRLLMPFHKEIFYATSFRVFRRSEFLIDDQWRNQKNLLYLWNIHPSKMAHIMVEHTQSRRAQSHRTVTSNWKNFYPLVIFALYRLGQGAMLAFMVASVLGHSSSWGNVFLGAFIISFGLCLLVYFMLYLAHRLLTYFALDLTRNESTS